MQLCTKCSAACVKHTHLQTVPSDQQAGMQPAQKVMDGLTCVDVQVEMKHQVSWDKHEQLLLAITC